MRASVDEQNSSSVDEAEMEWMWNLEPSMREDDETKLETMKRTVKTSLTKLCLLVQSNGEERERYAKQVKGVS